MGVSVFITFWSSDNFEIYFEEDNFDEFADKLKECDIEYVHPIVEHSWGQRVVRLHDPPQFQAEVGEHRLLLCAEDMGQVAPYSDLGYNFFDFSRNFQKTQQRKCSMKIFGRLFGFVTGLSILLCMLIAACAFRPDFSREIADFLFPEKKGSGTVETGGTPPESVSAAGGEREDEPEEEPSDHRMDEEDGEELKPEEEGAAEGSAGDRAGMDDKVASDYTAPDLSEIVTPKEVSGRNGYQQIEGEQEQVDEPEAREIRSRLDLGYTGDGLTFDALYYPYYAMLNERGKHVYRQIYANANELYAEFAPVEAVTAGELRNIFSALYNDHPELFWMETAYAGKFAGDGGCVEIDLKFNRTARDLESALALFDENAQEILTAAKHLESDYEKEIFVHDALIDKVEYRMGAVMNQSAYSAMVNGETVCAGYARAFQYLMQQLDIPCYYCTGYAGESHAWNIIGLEDGWYNVDTTWDDTGEGTYDYFNRTDAEYADSHVRQEMSVYLPSCGGQLYRGWEQGENGLRSLEETGITQDKVFSDIQEYYEDCRAQIVLNGSGSYTFYNVIEGEEILDAWYEEYQSRRYRDAYMDSVMEEIGAHFCEIKFEVEQLQGERYLIRHHVRFD